MSDPTPTRPPVPARVHARLRLALVAVSMLCALLVVGAGLLVWYWRTYLLEPRGDPFTRGP